MTPRPYSTTTKYTSSRDYLRKKPRIWIHHEHRFNFSVLICSTSRASEGPRDSRENMRSLATSSMSRTSMTHLVTMQKCNNITFNSQKRSAPHFQMRIRRRRAGKTPLCRPQISKHLKRSPTSSRSFWTNNILFAKNTWRRKTNRRTDRSLFKNWSHYLLGVVSWSCRLRMPRSTLTNQAILTDKSR